MRKLIIAALVALPLAVGAGAWAMQANAESPKADGYICPITGEELPCPACCPLNGGK